MFEGVKNNKDLEHRRSNSELVPDAYRHDPSIHNMLHE